MLTGSGYVVTGEKYISIGVRVPGRVDAYLVDESERVVRGQPLVQLDRRDYDAALSQAEAGLELARATRELKRLEVERLRVLRAQDVASQSQLDVKESEVRVAAAQVRQAEAEISQARVNLDYTTLRAPTDGVILAKLKEVGEMAVPGGFAGSGDLIRMANLQDMRAEVDVNEMDLGKVRLGQNAEVVPDAFPDRKYEAKVVKLYPQVNRQKGTLKVEVGIPGADEWLRPDTSVRIVFLDDAAPAQAGSRRGRRHGAARRAAYGSGRELRLGSHGGAPATPGDHARTGAGRPGGRGDGSARRRGARHRRSGRLARGRPARRGRHAAFFVVARLLT